MLGCVIMAAGNAVRFGANKLEAELDGKPLALGSHRIDCCGKFVGNGAGS